MVIRHALSGDIPCVAEAEKLCFPEDPWPEALFSRSADKLTVAAEGESILGYIVFSSVLDEGSIDNIAVAPGYRRRGVADALISNAIEKAQEAGLSVIYLEVRASNAPAIALYKKHGFREVGRRRSYYEKPREDAILMTLVL